MSNGRIPITRAGAAMLKSELKRLKSVERPKVIDALEEARGHGDLSENADYDAAKHQQAFIEGRIADLESKLANAEIIDVSKLKGDQIRFGATVTVEDEDGATITYQVVGDVEADIKKNKLSVNSPIARALIGREAGESITVKGPKGGEKEYEILAVEYREEEIVEE